MKKILKISNDLSQALQRKDQDIVNVMKLVGVSKEQLQNMKLRDFDSLLQDIYSFCGIYKIEVPNMDSMFMTRGRLWRKTY